MWIALALASAVASACTVVFLKRTVAFGSVIASTAALRLVAGVVLVGVIVLWQMPVRLTATFWSVTALVMLPEVLGTLLLSLALREGDVSLVKPMLGVVPLFVLLGGVVVLAEVPTLGAASGVVLVMLGIYAIGVRRGMSLLEPLRALGRERASRYALGAALCWTATTLLHKFGIAEVGAIVWAATLAFGSAAGLALVHGVRRRSKPAVRAAPLAQRRGRVGTRHLLWIALTGLAFALHQLAFQSALGLAFASYVLALSSTSTLIAAGIGIALLGERAAWRSCALGALLITAGAVLVALGA
jgi:uncharacterized membrane protein